MKHKSYRLSPYNEVVEAEYGEQDLKEIGLDKTLDSQKLEQKIHVLNQRLKARQDKLQEPPVGTAKVEVLPDPEQKAPKPKKKGSRQGKVKLQKAQDALKKLKEDSLPCQEKSEDQERKLAGRNSYSKTDVDATFRRMKDVYMKNGQLKPGYNL